MNENNDFVIPRFMTIKQVSKLGIMSIYSQRLMLAAGKLPGYYAGTRFYVNVDKLLAELNGDTTRCDNDGD